MMNTKVFAIISHVTFGLVSGISGICDQSASYAAVAGQSEASFCLSMVDLCLWDGASCVPQKRFCGALALMGGDEESGSSFDALRLACGATTLAPRHYASVTDTDNEAGSAEFLNDCCCGAGEMWYNGLRSDDGSYGRCADNGFKGWDHSQLCDFAENAGLDYQGCGGKFVAPTPTTPPEPLTISERFEAATLGTDLETVQVLLPELSKEEQVIAHKWLKATATQHLLVALENDDYELVNELSQSEFISAADYELATAWLKENSKTRRLMENNDPLII